MNASQKTVTSNGHACCRLRVLFVEDSETDAFLLERALKLGGFDVYSRRVDTADSMRAALGNAEWDLILADHAMPQFSAPEALELVKAKNLELPFIIVSGHIEEQTAISAMQAGAHDYIMKDRLARLVPAVERELREAEMRRARKKSEEELRRAHEELETRVEKRTADLKAAYQTLQNLLDERRRLENELLEIAENERRRIGFDLHDDLGQKLTGVLLLSRAIEQRLTAERHPSAEDARNVSELIQSTVHHTHNLAHQFSSLDANGGELADALKELAGNVKKMFGVVCEFSQRGEMPPLLENTAMQFCKIAQEAISNAVKHGHAAQIWISLWRQPDKLVLTIKNDGVPFSLPEEKKGRMGLRIMNYRANTVGATFEIKPNQKNGTIVACALPLRNGSKVSRANGDLPQAPPNRIKKIRLDATVENVAGAC